MSVTQLVPWNGSNNCLACRESLEEIIEHMLSVRSSIDNLLVNWTFCFTIENLDRILRQIDSIWIRDFLCLSNIKSFFNSLKSESQEDSLDITPQDFINRFLEFLINLSNTENPCNMGFNLVDSLVFFFVLVNILFWYRFWVVFQNSFSSVFDEVKKSNLVDNDCVRYFLEEVDKIKVNLLSSEAISKLIERQFGREKLAKLIALGEERKKEQLLVLFQKRDSDLSHCIKCILEKGTLDAV